MPAYGAVGGSTAAISGVIARRRNILVTRGRRPLALRTCCSHPPVQQFLHSSSISPSPLILNPKWRRKELVSLLETLAGSKHPDLLESISEKSRPLSTILYLLAFRCHFGIVRFFLSTAPPTALFMKRSIKSTLAPLLTPKSSSTTTPAGPVASALWPSTARKPPRTHSSRRTVLWLMAMSSVSI